MNGSFARRIAVAVLLLVGFYAFALLVALGAIALIVVQWATDAPQNIWVSFACAVTALAILTSIIPRRRPFEAPGPELTPEAQPALQGLVEEVSARAGQEPPARIYLAPDVNAAVTQAGGLLGAGGTRVMLVGLPLMDVLTVRELRSVIGHELGHFNSGDTRLGPWFFRTYDALERTVIKLHEAESIWRKPFTWYMDFFLRRTSSLKRRQEFLADELAVRTAGKDATLSGLRAISRAAPAFDGYWSGELVPVLESGHRVPLVEGFRSFRDAEGVSSAVDDLLDAQKEVQADPYDTHPTLVERVAAIERLPDADAPARPGDERPALSLLTEVDELELALLSVMAGEAHARELEQIDWHEVPERVMVPGWQQFLERHRGKLAGITASDIPDQVDDLQGLVARLLPAEERPPEIDVQRGYGVAVMGTALGLALHRDGWRVEAPAGEPVSCTRDGQRVAPHLEIERLAAGELSAPDWRARCHELGIADLVLEAESKPSSSAV